MKRLLLICAAVAASAFSCDHKNETTPETTEPDKTKDWAETVTIHVSPELGTFNDGESGLELECMQIREGDEKDWKPAMLGEIEGFEYIRGFEYELKVEKTHLIDPPVGASDRRYRLEEIVYEKFTLGEGYEMCDDYIHYGKTSYHEESRDPITKRAYEYYLAVRKTDKEEALAYLDRNGFTIMENSEEGTGTFYALRGKLKDCFQITVKGSGNIDEVPGVLYTSPLYNNDEWFKEDTFGRGNMILISFTSRWDNEKQIRHIPYIEKYAEMLDIYLISKNLSQYGNYLTFGVTNESAGNAVEIHNWFSEVAGYSICDLNFPEFAPTIDD